MPDPDRQTVVAWVLERPGRTAEDAADRFWPGHADRARLLGRVRQWISRARRAASRLPPAGRAQGSDEDGAERGRPATEAKVVEGPPRPDPDYDRARSDRVAFLEWQLAEDIADLTWARASGMIGRVAALDARVSEVRLQLDQARDAAGSTVELDANPDQIAAEIAKRQKLIDELTAARQRRERTL